MNSDRVLERLEEPSKIYEIYEDHGSYRLSSVAQSGSHGGMKGTIISGEEVLKIVTSGDLENISKIYEIYKTGPTQSDGIIDGWFGSISNLCLETIIQDCYNDNLIFIKIEK